MKEDKNVRSGETEDVAEKTSAGFDPDKFEYLVVSGEVKRGKEKLIRCRVPRILDTKDKSIMFGMNGQYKTIQFNEWIEIAPEWADFIEERLANMARLASENEKLVNE